ncbi:MAG: hypothetical protein QOJ75_2138 [Chloroflexota bacterium]|nr:hypothetical protein [Chloroflexota bacterium]
MTTAPDLGRRRGGRKRRRPVRPNSILQLRLATLFAAQFFDFGTFTVMIGRHGIVAEANPIVAQGFLVLGLPLVAMTKLALIVLVGAVVVLLGRADPSRRTSIALSAIVTVVAVGAGLVGGISNARVAGW